MVYRHFDRQFPEGILENWTPTWSTNQGFDSIDISNRYLTPLKDVSGLESIPFHKGVDPRGILQNMAKGNGSTTHVHTEDNQVQYFSTKRDAEGNVKSVNHLS